MTGPGQCQQPGNPLVPNPGLRALLVALDAWVTAGKKPPASRVPRRSNGTLVSSTPQEEAGFPSIPGVTYNGLMTTGDLFDFGRSFDQGILSNLPPIFLGSPYPAFVPRADADGNDIAGIRLPEIEVPLATYTGWSLRATAFAGDDLCDASGQKLDFAQTKAERLALGDPRPSIEERYPTHEKYVKDVTHAAKQLLRQRLLLAEDVQRVHPVSRGEQHRQVTFRFLQRQFRERFPSPPHGRRRFAPSVCLREWQHISPKEDRYDPATHVGWNSAHATVDSTECRLARGRDRIRSAN